jgi:hypothetical protein
MSEAPTTPDLGEAIQSERRLEERHVVHWPVLLSWTTPTGPAAGRGRTNDLSLGGARVALQHNFAIGDKLACRLSVQPWHGNSAMFDVDMTARVAYCAYSSQHGGFDIGLQFQSFAGDGKARLAKVIESLQLGAPIAKAKIIHGMK